MPLGSGSEYNKVVRHQAFSFPAKIYNKLVDVAAGQDFDRGDKEPPFFRNADIVLVRNDSGSDLTDRYQVLGLYDSLITPELDFNEFKNGRVASKGQTPAAAGKYAVMLEPVRKGAIGRGVVAGVTAVQLTIADPTNLLAWAEINAGSAATLLNAASGSAFVLWAENNGQTTQWALVRLGGGAAKDNDLTCYARFFTNALPAYTNAAGVLTASANGALPSANCDGVTPATGDKVLFALEGSASVDYGVYVLTQGDASHPWVLTPDSSVTLQPGLQVFVQEGVNDKHTVFSVLTNAPLTPLTTAVQFGRYYPEAKWVKITSTTQTSGRYPGTLYNNDTGTTGSGETVWVVDANGGSLALSTFYAAVRGSDANGRAVYFTGLQGGGTDNDLVCFARFMTSNLPAYTFTSTSPNVLQATANGALTSANCDGVTPAAGNKLLFTSGAGGPGTSEGDAAGTYVQGSGFIDYGVYVITQVGDATHPWILTADPTVTMQAGLQVFVQEGANNQHTVWTQIDNDPIGTTAPMFARIYPEVNTVQVTSTTPTSGRYPGKIYSTDHVDPTRLCWVKTANGETPETGVWYSGFRGFDAGSPRQPVYWIQPCIASLNGLSNRSQTFAVGTAGTDFHIVSAAGVHTWHLPDASPSNRGAVTTGLQLFGGSKGVQELIVVGDPTQFTSSKDVSLITNFAALPQVLKVRKSSDFSGAGVEALNYYVLDSGTTRVAIDGNGTVAELRLRGTVRIAGGDGTQTSPPFTKPVAPVSPTGIANPSVLCEGHWIVNSGRYQQAGDTMFLNVRAVGGAGNYNQIVQCSGDPTTAFYGVKVGGGHTALIFAEMVDTGGGVKVSQCRILEGDAATTSGTMRFALTDKAGNTNSGISITAGALGPGANFVGGILTANGGGFGTSWNGTPPTNFTDACDRCAALLKSLNGGVGP